MWFCFTPVESGEGGPLSLSLSLSRVQRHEDVVFFCHLVVSPFGESRCGRKEAARHLVNVVKWESANETRSGGIVGVELRANREVAQLTRHLQG